MEPTHSPILWGQKIALSVFEQRTRHITPDHTYGDVFLHVPSAAEVLTRSALLVDAHKRLGVTVCAVVQAIGFGLAKKPLGNVTVFDLHSLLHNDSGCMNLLVLKWLKEAHMHPAILSCEAMSPVLAKQARDADLGLLVALVHTALYPTLASLRAALETDVLPDTGLLAQFQNGEKLWRHHRAKAAQISQEVFWSTESEGRERTVEDEPRENRQKRAIDGDGGSACADSKRECLDSEGVCCAVA